MVYHDWLIQIQDMHEDGLLILYNYWNSQGFFCDRNARMGFWVKFSNSVNHGMVWYMIHSQHRTWQLFGNFWQKCPTFDPLFSQWCWWSTPSMLWDSPNATNLYNMTGDGCSTHLWSFWRWFIIGFSILQYVYSTIYIYIIIYVSLGFSTKIFRCPLVQLALS